MLTAAEEADLATGGASEQCISANFKVLLTEVYRTQTNLNCKILREPILTSLKMKEKLAQLVRVQSVIMYSSETLPMRIVVACSMVGGHS